MTTGSTASRTRTSSPKACCRRSTARSTGCRATSTCSGSGTTRTCSTSSASSSPTTIDEMEADMAKAVAAGKQGMTLTGKPGLESQWQGFPWFTSHGFSYGDPQAEPMADTYSMLQDWVAQGLPVEGGRDVGPDDSVPAVRCRIVALRGERQLADRRGQGGASSTASRRCRSRATAECCSVARCRTSAPSRSTRSSPRSSSSRPFFSVGWRARPARRASAPSPVVPTPRRPPRSATTRSSSVFADIVQNQGRPSPSPQVPVEERQRGREPRRRLLEPGGRRRGHARRSWPTTSSRSWFRS